MRGTNYAELRIAHCPVLHRCGLIREHILGIGPPILYDRKVRTWPHWRTLYHSVRIGRPVTVCTPADKKLRQPPHRPPRNPPRHPPSAARQAPPAELCWPTPPKKHCAERPRQARTAAKQWPAHRATMVVERGVAARAHLFPRGRHSHCLAARSVHYGRARVARAHSGVTPSWPASTPATACLPTCAGATTARGPSSAGCRRGGRRQCPVPERAARRW